MLHQQTLQNASVSVQGLDDKQKWFVLVEIFSFCCCCFFSSTAGIIRVSLCWHPDTSSASKVMLYTSAKKITTSGLTTWIENSTAYNCSFLFLLFRRQLKNKSKIDREKSEDPDSISKLKKFHEIQKGWQLCVRIRPTMNFQSTNLELQCRNDFFWKMPIDFIDFFVWKWLGPQQMSKLSANLSTR